jgi:ATP-binding cassette, subfamily B, bacterial
MPGFQRSSRLRYRDYLKARKTVKRDLAVEPSPDGSDRRKGQKRSRSFWMLFAAFWGMLRGKRGRVVAALATLTVSAVLALMLPAGTKVAIDYIITDAPGPAGIPDWAMLPDWLRDPARRVDLLWLLGAVLVVITTVRILFSMWGRWQMTKLTKRTQLALRRRVFDHAVRLPLHRVHQLKSGGAASIIREDAGGAAELMFHIIYNPWNAIVQLSGTLIILAIVDWRLLLGAIVLIPVVWVTHRTWIGRIRPIFRDIKNTRSAIDAHATEAFGGIRVVRGFDRQTAEAARFTTGTHYMARQELLAWWWSRGVDIAWAMLIPLASVGVLLYGGIAVIRGTLTIGDVMMFSAYLMMLLGPLETLASSAASMQTNLAALDRVLDVLGEPREFEDTAGEVTVHRSTTEGRITLSDVWFSYPVRPAARRMGGEGGTAPAVPEPEYVLQSISLDVEPGETIALVGPSGSGKTTLCNLIARFFDPTRGSIQLDGVDLRQIDVNSYRRLLGIVEQDVFLFDGTIAENIGYGRRDSTMPQLIEAARAANAHGFIERLEYGYETLIGERGVRLSGGQKQRIAIARAILADPRILILDEATSSLDTESERLIQRSLMRLMRGRTSFVIAHRLSTIRHADRIVVLEQGQIIEVGTHDELLASGGRYAEFLRMQVDQKPEDRGEDSSPSPAQDIGLERI